MSAELGGITNKSIRDAVGNRCFTAGQLAIDGTNIENVETTAAVVHTINGVFQTDLAIKAEIDLSAITVISAKDGATLDAPVTSPALNAGDDAVTKVYVLACKGDTVYIVEPEIDNASQDRSNHPLTVPDGYAGFGLIKIERTPTPSVGVAAFTLGTTNLSGVTNQTVTFFDCAVVPATVADIVET